MKKLLQFLFPGITILVVFCTIASAQTPQTFNYQAIARDNTGDPIINTAVSVRVAILRGSPPGFLLWEEQHSVTTNGFGLFTVSVGDPAASKSGGSLSSFSEIWWHSGPLSIRPSIEYQSTWYQLEESPLASVPYALYAKKVEEGQFPVNGDTIYLPTGSLSIGSDQAGGSKLAVVSSDDSSGDPLFEVKRADGQTVFAVYSDAVRAYVAPVIESKGRARGGFSVGGFDRTKATITDDLFWLTPDSIRFYIDDTPEVKGRRGGFSVGGFDRSKGSNQEFLRVTSDSTRVYAKFGEKSAGFGVEGFADTISEPQEYMRLNQHNSFVGLQAGESTIPEPGWITGINNSFIGYKSGFHNIYGINNVFIGHKSGYNNIGTDFRFGSNNILIGSEVGYNNKFGTDNIMIGSKAGYSTIGSDDIFSPAGNDNVYIGQNAGYANIDGLSNVYIGERSGESDLHGKSNTFLGSFAGRYFTGGTSNIFIGDAAGYSVSSGDYNIILGYNAGPINPTPLSNNIFIGTNSGRGETGNNKLYIENSNATKDNALIYGDFANDRLTFNANIGIGVLDPDVRLKVEGGTDVTLANGAGFLQLGSNNNINLIMDENEIQARNAGAASALNIQNEGGNLFIGGSTTIASSLLVSGSHTIGSSTTPTNVGLNVYGKRSSNYIANFVNDGNSSSYYGLRIQAGRDIPGGGEYQHFIHCFDGDGDFEGGLTLINGTLTLYQVSDERRKKDIKSTSINASEIIGKLRVVDYKFKESGYGIQTGFIAQEAREVYPDMVMYDNELDFYGVSQTQLIPVLTKALQEQDTESKRKDLRISDLEAENADIKTRLEALESMVEVLLQK